MWPGLSSYPGSTSTTTTCGVFPVIVEPDFEIELATRTRTKAGSGGGGGGGPLPGSVDQLRPQAGLVIGLLAKPLKAAGAGPPLSELSFDHCAAQKVTAVPTAELTSPITNEPPAVAAPMRTVHEVVAVLPPTSLIV